MISAKLSPSMSLAPATGPPKPPETPVIPVKTAGQAYLFFGGASATLATTQPVVLTGVTGVSGGFGGPVAGAGDIDGDGFADVMVAAPRMSNVYFYRGGASRQLSPGQPPLITGPAAAGAFFGSAIAWLRIERARAWTDTGAATLTQLNL